MRTVGATTAPIEGWNGVVVHVFARRFPDTHLCIERTLVLAGEEQRIVTAGGGSLWQELLLYLVARFLGREAAAQTARLYLMDWGERTSRRTRSFKSADSTVTR